MTTSSIQRYTPENEYFFIEGCYINELSNQASDADVSIARAKVRPGVTTQWHQLVNTVERYIILEGNGLVEVGDKPAEPVFPGDIVIIPASTPQRITNNGDSDLIFLAICTPRFIEKNYQIVVDADS